MVDYGAHWPNGVHLRNQCFCFCFRCFAKRTASSSSSIRSSILIWSLRGQPTIGQLWNRINRFHCLKWDTCIQLVLLLLLLYFCQKKLTVIWNFVEVIQEHCCTHRCGCNVCFELDVPMVFSWLDRYPKWFDLIVVDPRPWNRPYFVSHVGFATIHHFQHQSIVVSSSQSPCIALMSAAWISVAIHFENHPAPKYRDHMNDISFWQPNLHLLKITETFLL